MSVEELLNFYYDQFSDNEKYVCHYLSRHFDECACKTIDEFAVCCNVSKTVLVRFAKKIGMTGYGELKARIKIELQERRSDTRGHLQIMTESYHKMMADLNKKNLTVFFERLYLAKRIFVFGSGSSQERAASEMKRIFLPVRDFIYLHGHDMYDALQRIARPEDLVIIISLSGESDAVVELAKRLRVRQVPLVSITRMTGNRLASVCHENLYIHSVRLPAKYHIDYESSTPYFILIEYLYLSYQNYLFFKRRNQEE